MNETSKKKKSGDVSKEKSRKRIEKKLEAALAPFKPLLGEKKFRKRIKKAGKILSHNLDRRINQKPPKQVKSKSPAEKPVEEQ
jgi:hypothetical protein